MAAAGAHLAEAHVEASGFIRFNFATSFIIVGVVDAVQKSAHTVQRSVIIRNNDHRIWVGETDCGLGIFFAEALCEGNDSLGPEGLLAAVGGFSWWLCPNEKCGAGE